MVIHNPDVQTYAKLLQRAENEGIYVIQINMGSAYRSFGLRRRQLDRDRRTPHRGGRQGLQGQVEQDRDRAGRAVGGGERLHAQGRRERARQASRNQGGLEPGRRLGCSESQGDHPDGAEAKSRSLRHRRLLGRHGHRHRGRGQGSRASPARCSSATSGGGERKGACELVKSGAFDLDISYDVPTQAAQMAATDQVAAVVGGQARIGQGLGCTRR